MRPASRCNSPCGGASEIRTARVTVHAQDLSRQPIGVGFPGVIAAARRLAL
jgi:hypothetical protein